VREVDVIKFGDRYCAQNPRAAAILDAVVAGLRPSRCRRSGRNSLITRKLREAGLVVLTASSVRSGPGFGRASAPLPSRPRHA
jgi:hypothetical protein